MRSVGRARIMDVAQLFVVFCRCPHFFESRAAGDDLLVDKIKVERSLDAVLIRLDQLTFVASGFTLGLGVFIPSEYQEVSPTRGRDSCRVAFEKFDRTPNKSLHPQ